MLTPNALVDRLLASQIATRDNIVGCTDDDIRQLECATQCQLPGAYLRFLRSIGRGAGCFLRDINIYYPTVLTLNVEARSILDNWEEGRLVLPANAVVFSIRQGEQFMFFIADGNHDDPPIFHYMEDRGEFRKIAESLWDVIEHELELTEQVKQEFPDAPCFQ